MSSPPQSVIEWASNQIAPDAKIVKAFGLHKGSNPWLLHVDHNMTGPTDAVLRVSDQRRWPMALANETTALRLAAACGLAAPRLIAADLDGHDAGTTAVLQTVLPGSSAPRVASDERLAAFGAAGAAFHAVSPPPGFELPLRTHPIPPDDHALARRWAVRYRNASGEQAREAVLQELHATHGWPVEGAREGLPKVGTTPLLMEADERLLCLPIPATEPVVVHGDLHQGNMMWQDDTVVGLVDLGSLGAGHYGVDLGYMRMTMAIEYGGLCKSRAERDRGRRCQPCARQP